MEITTPHNRLRKTHDVFSRLRPRWIHVDNFALVSCRGMLPAVSLGYCIQTKVVPLCGTPKVRFFWVGDTTGFSATDWPEYLLKTFTNAGLFPRPMEAVLLREGPGVSCVRRAPELGSWLWSHRRSNIRISCSFLFTIKSRSQPRKKSVQA